MYSTLRHLPALFYKHRPVQLTFFVTRRCNAKCPFCFYLQCEGELPEQQGELQLDEIDALAPTIGPLLWLAFSGGEPYLRRDLDQIARTFYRHTRPSIILISTNALTPRRIQEQTEAILRDCPRSVVVVKLSLDGVGDDHDQLRATPGSFDKTLATYQALAPLLNRYANFELGINTVFCADNQDKMDQIIDFVQTLSGIRTHTISMVRGNLQNKGLQCIDLVKYQRAVERLEGGARSGGMPRYQFRGARLKAAQDILQRRYIAETLTRHQRLIPCYAGRANLVLTETGEVYPCEMLDESFGNVRRHDYDMRRILRSDAAQAVRRDIDTQRCYCTHECHLMTNILLNPRLYPALAREYLGLAAS
ncbi:MAG: hypothetical protein AMJ69_09505 [Gammaproteobacteria bacterium SG8_47]|nr:MAG: hypothetical protein AMJ69_09505 [Gammaproteobacteria bacterium SG8_47]